MGYQFIVVRRSSQVTTITLSRPEVMNAIHSPMHAELDDALDAFAADAQQRVCVLTGAGERAFCAGSDLKYAANSASGLGEGDRAYPRSGYGGIAQRFDLTKPVIAAVNGVALGGGFEIVLSCDLVIAADTALFGLPEPLVGAIAFGGGLHRLPRQIGLKPALGIILTGRKVSAAEGKALGFINEVVPQTELATTADRWAADILRCSPSRFRHRRRSSIAVWPRLPWPTPCVIRGIMRDFAPGSSLRTCAKGRARSLRNVRRAGQPLLRKTTQTNRPGFGPSAHSKP